MNHLEKVLGARMVHAYESQRGPQGLTINKHGTLRANLPVNEQAIRAHVYPLLREALEGLLDALDSRQVDDIDPALAAGRNAIAAVDALETGNFGQNKPGHWEYAQVTPDQDLELCLEHVRTVAGDVTIGYVSIAVGEICRELKDKRTALYHATMRVESLEQQVADLVEKGEAEGQEASGG